MSGPLAIVDVGSNSLRLFLCDGRDASGPVGERITTVTALRRGAAPDGTLAEDALARLDECLADYGARAARAGARTGMALGTSAVRDAPNRERVARAVAEHLGLPLTVLTGDQEAALAFAGARVAVPEPEGVLVVDVGGASTEIVRGVRGRAPATVSLQLGGVRTSEALLHSDPPTAGELADLARVAGAAAADGLEAIGGAGAGDEPVVGVAGTITTLAAVDNGAYDPAAVHGRVLSRDRVAELLHMLAALPLAERRRVPGLEPARAPAIVGGAGIVLAVLDAVGATAMTVSERDLLDGAALNAGALARPVQPGAAPEVVRVAIPA